MLHQALQVARLVSEDEWSQRKVMNEVLRELPEAEWHQSSPAEVLGEAIATARDTLKVKEPFGERRAEVQRTFAALAQEHRARVEAAESPAEALALAVTGAAAANMVDELVFPRFARRDPKAVLDEALEEGFASGSPADLEAALAEVEVVLYMLDNAGEVHFDAILIDHLRSQGKRVLVAVRGGGLLHDATAADVFEAGIFAAPPTASEEAMALEAGEPAADADAADAEEAGAAPEEAPAEPEAAPATEPDGEAAAEGAPPATDLIELSYGALSPKAKGGSLRQALEDAGLVIAKGSASYESLGSQAVEVVHLLRVKCPPVAGSLGVTPGSLVLLRVPASSGE
jgi:uncharacterized protein with ATP-grasp and redox domains